ncbi:MAG: SycD/LcrH family type III secretion system chaperone [Parachlamydiaceae bacterium]
MDENAKEQIREIIEKVTPNLSKEDKAKQEELLQQVFEEGKQLKDVLNVSNETIEYLYSQAYQLYKTGKYPEANRYFHILYILESQDVRFPMGIAACHHMQKHYRQAVEWYYLCAALDDTSPLPYYHISDCFLKLGEKLSALIALRMLGVRITDEPQFAKIKEKSQRMMESLTEEIKQHRLQDQVSENAEVLNSGPAEKDT